MRFTDKSRVTAHKEACGTDARLESFGLLFLGFPPLDRTAATRSRDLYARSALLRTLAVMIWMLILKNGSASQDLIVASWSSNGRACHDSGPYMAQDSQEDLRQREALAFLVGWYSKTVLVAKASDKPAAFVAIQFFLDVLKVRLDHSLPYYLDDVQVDGGKRAQAFTQQVYEQLLASDRKVANHFGVAADLILIIARCACDDGAPRAVRNDLSTLATQLDIPPTLQRVPEMQVLQWAFRIERYFARLVSKRSLPPSGPDHVGSIKHFFGAARFQQAGKIFIEHESCAGQRQLEHV